MARTYRRDARGRFAGGGGGGGGGSRRPPARQVSRERNRLTRDNSGRITGIGGSGATARGGRLRTGAGNLRATQTDRLKGRIGGTVKKPKGLKAQAGVNIQTGRKTATSKLRPGELMNANARPVNTMARFRKGENPFGNKKGQNIDTAISLLKAQGVKTVDKLGKRSSGAAAWAQQDYQRVVINTSHGHWKNPKASAIHNRRSGNLSTSDPRGTLFHEAAHLKLRQVPNFFNLKDQKMAGRVSRYARMNPKEFTSEVYAGLKTGRKYDSQVMKLYRMYAGLSPRPAARRRSRLPKR